MDIQTQKKENDKKRGGGKREREKNSVCFSLFESTVSEEPKKRKEYMCESVCVCVCMCVHVAQLCCVPQEEEEKGREREAEEGEEGVEPTQGGEHFFRWPSLRVCLSLSCLSLSPFIWVLFGVGRRRSGLEES